MILVLDDKDFDVLNLVGGGIDGFDCWASLEMMGTGIILGLAAWDEYTSGSDMGKLFLLSLAGSFFVTYGFLKIVVGIEEVPYDELACTRNFFRLLFMPCGMRV